MAFPITLTKEDRQHVHDFADILGLSHISKGSGNNRCITVQKPLQNDPLDDIIKAHGNIINGRFTNGYIALIGSYLESLTESYITKYKSKIPESFIANRVKRDSNEHHVTLILPHELDKVIEHLIGSTPSVIHTNKKGKASAGLKTREDIINGIQSFLDTMEKEVECDWKHLGLGFAKYENEEAYFVVIQWNSFNAFRERLGLGRRDLHVTLGFKRNDIHNEGIRKDESSLMLDFGKLDLNSTSADEKTEEIILEN